MNFTYYICYLYYILLFPLELRKAMILSFLFADEAFEEMFKYLIQHFQVF
jgi:hypothetical protein